MIEVENAVFLTSDLTEYNHFIKEIGTPEDRVSIKIKDDACTMDGKNVIFGCSIGKKLDGWQFHLMDYIMYNRLYGRKIIVLGAIDDYNEALRVYGDHNIYDCYLRSHEPKILVHSTTRENYRLIQKDGYLKSWNLLKKTHPSFENEPIGTLLGDPADISDYIMLGGGVSCEIVVLSKQKGEICMDCDAEYMPGARIYFDSKVLANQGLLERDGLHLKVKNQLPLNLAVFTATLENVIIDGKTTPKTFAEAADKAFEKSRSMI